MNAINDDSGAHNGTGSRGGGAVTERNVTRCTFVAADLLPITRDGRLHRRQTGSKEGGSGRCAWLYQRMGRTGLP